MPLLRHITSAAQRLAEQEYEAYMLLGLPLLEKGRLRFESLVWDGKAQELSYVRWLGGVAGCEELRNRLGLLRRRYLLLGVALGTILQRNAYWRYYVLGVQLWARPDAFWQRFAGECAARIAGQHDHVYILTRHLGDSFQVLTLIAGIIRSHASRHPLLLVFTQPGAELARMMCPDLPCLYIASSYPYMQELNARFTCERFAVGGLTFIMLFNDWYFATAISEQHRLLGERSWRMLALANCYAVSYDRQRDGRAAILADAERSMLRKCAEQGFDPGHFVFLAPEVFTLRPLRRRFWSELIRRFRAAGYAVFINALTDKPESEALHYVHRHPSRAIHPPASGDYASFYLTLAEAYALAARAQRIVSMRSGLTELLAQLGVAMDVLYTGVDQAHARQTMKLYALEQFPGADMEKIREINMMEIPEAQCLDLICPQGGGRARRDLPGLS